VCPFIVFIKKNSKAIHGYRETERKTWTQRNKSIIERVKQVAFPADASPLAHVHVLDLLASGVIKPHIDSVRVSISSVVLTKLFLKLFENNLSCVLSSST